MGQSICPSHYKNADKLEDDVWDQVVQVLTRPDLAFVAEVDDVNE